MKISELKRFRNVPTGAWKFFENSYVKFQPRGSNSGYHINNGKPTISVDPLGTDVPLFHEIGHFVVAPLNRLRKKNYGYNDFYTGNKWHDLDCEIQVCAIEANLLEDFNYPSEFKSDKERIEGLFFLRGWRNYRHAKGLSRRSMHQRVLKRFRFWREEWCVSTVEKEWNRRNTLLKKGIV